MSPFKLTWRTLPAGIGSLTHFVENQPSAELAVCQIPQLSDHVILMEPSALPTSPSLSPSPLWLEIDVQGFGELRSTSQCVPHPYLSSSGGSSRSPFWEMVPHGGMSELVFIVSLTLARVT